MRSALLCVIFAILAQRKGCHADRYDEEFNPIPIPLKEWNHKPKSPTGTLQETIKTEAPIAAAALPAHYWEDALRHTVYLTLVRDKIDQLIAKCVILSPDQKPTSTLPKEVDDHDLWEKIKTAPFDRLKEDSIPPGDISIIAKGRLIEENGGFKFAEDKPSQQTCSEGDCSKGVKAFWSVKRERQRDIEPSTGKYHYELTFSVTSETPMKSKKRLENPVRMFTVRENGPTDAPQFRRSYDSYRKAPVKPQPSVWVHKNIGHTYEHRRKPNLGNLDRLFSSFFSDEDLSENTHRYNPGLHQKGHQPYSKIGHSGEREFKESFYHKKNPPFSLTPQSFKFSRPQLPSPPLSYMHHAFVDMDHFGKSPYMPMGTDIKLIPNTIKTTRPAVLPTPVAPITFAKESTVEAPVKTLYNTSETTTKPGIVTAQSSFKPNTHSKPTSVKPNYSSAHVRPPIYSAPPGVFVTMDKKPFKPMPPLKVIHSSLNLKGPSDFRPSPQVLDDVHISEPDSYTAFKPIAVGYPDVSKKNEDSNKNNQKHLRKTNNKKPTKQSSIKTHRTTTTIPDIITAKDDSDEFDLEWANILGAMSKTTPMASYKDKANDTDTIDSITTTASPISTTQIESEIADTTTSTTTTSTTTTTSPKPTKRTRPPPKYKQVKYKKHKRITTTTTSSTTTTTTANPLKSTTEKRTTEDLTPQASSAATGGTNNGWEIGNRTTTSNPTTSPKPVSTTARSTTTFKITTTPPTSTTAVKTERPLISTIEPKNKNRFRQSTLIYKGTSVKHDKWSAQPSEKSRTSPVFPSKAPVRRLTSKFRGYHSSPAPTTEKLVEKEMITTSESSPIIETNKDNHTHSTSTPEINQNEETDNNNKPALNSIQVEEITSDAAVKDTEEYIFTTTVTQDSTKNNSIEKQTVEVTTSPYDTTKNKTKCKKKKHDNVATTVESSSETPSSTEKLSNDIFDEMLGGFTMDDEFQEDVKPSTLAPIPDIEESESEKHERYIVGDDFESFLESLEGKGNYEAENSEESGEDDENDEDEEYQLSSEEDEESDSKKSHYEDDIYYEDKEKQGARPYSLLELMAMQ